ncbi:MAG: hypothetical protein LBI29_03545 [Rickettsiales bacterium]|nr:hypothetical protein [Rickettsiales bacterium]
MKNKKLYLFCLNDVSFATAEDRKEVKNFLEELFPEKSLFEVR